MKITKAVLLAAISLILFAKTADASPADSRERETKVEKLFADNPAVKGTIASVSKEKAKCGKITLTKTSDSDSYSDPDTNQITFEALIECNEIDSGEANFQITITGTFYEKKQLRIDNIKFDYAG